MPRLRGIVEGCDEVVLSSAMPSARPMTPKTVGGCGGEDDDGAGGFPVAPDAITERDDLAQSAKDSAAEAEQGGEAANAPSVSEAQQEYEADAPKANLVVIGETGVGKSTLLNAVFGEQLARVGVGKPVTDAIRIFEDDRCPVRIYDTPGLLMNESPDRISDDVLALIQKGHERGPDHHIHMVWFCTPGTGGLKFEPPARQIVQSLSSKLPVFLVLTQVPDPGDPRLQKWIAEKVRPAELEVVEERAFCTLAQPLVTAKAPITTHGLDDLIEHSTKILPAAAQRAFAAALTTTDASLALKRSEARKVVFIASSASALVGATPIPGSDAIPLGIIQVAMVARINTIFAISTEDHDAAKLFSALLTAGAVQYTGKAVASALIKFIPGLGSVVGASVAGTLTLAFGEAYIQTLSRFSRKRLLGEEIDVDDLLQFFMDTIKSVDIKHFKQLKKDQKSWAAPE